MAKLPPIPTGARATQLRALVEESLPTIGGVISRKEAAWLQRVAEHPAADAEVRAAIFAGTRELRLSDTAAAAGAAQFLASLQDTVERPASGSVLDVRTAADEALARPFGEKEAELPSLPPGADAARLREILKLGWRDVTDGGTITTAELAWCHALATHPSSDRALCAELADRLNPDKLHDDVDRAIFHRFQRGLRGELPLVAAPPAAPKQEVAVSLELGAPAWPSPAQDLDAAALGFLVDEHIRAHRKTFAPGESQTLGKAQCAWLLEVARHPQADADLARKIAWRMGGFRIEADAVAGGGERLKQLLSAGQVPGHSPPGVSRDSVRVALDFVRDVLTGAAGADRRLSQSALSEALRPLAPVETAAVVDMYEAVAKTRQVVTVDALQAAYTDACAALDAGQAAALAAHEVTQLCAWGASLVNLAHEVESPSPFAGLEGDALRDALRASAAGHICLGYDRARQLLFSELHNDAGIVKDVYTNRDLFTSQIPEHEGDLGVNTEHTFPKSRGVKGTAAESDLHHLFPTDTDANARRSSYPFGVVVEEQWSEMGARLGLDASGELVFEPPDEHKGNVARALFYVSTAYELEIDAAQEKTLRAWNLADPPDADERVRNDRVERMQGNRNPFVDDPSLADRIDDF